MKFVLTQEPLNKRYVHHNEDCPMVRRHGSSYVAFPARVIATKRAALRALWRRKVKQWRA
jgi:hypothetical protein